MVRTFKVYLGDKSSNNPVYSCAHCRSHLAKHENLISKSFQGSQGRAYLFDSVVNVISGRPEDRVLLTGLHSVADIKCECCRTVLGWKYEHAFEPSQKYKEGKFIIEVAHLIKDTNWDNVQIPNSSQSCCSPTLSCEINSTLSVSPVFLSPLSSLFNVSEVDADNDESNNHNSSTK